MVNFSLNEEQALVQKTARGFAIEHLAPGVIKRDETETFPGEQIKMMGELGFMGMMIPEEWGGSGMDTISYVLALEEIAAVDASAAVVMSVNNSLVCQLMLDCATDAQKEKFLKPLATGKLLGAYSLSEPQSGSDASNMCTTAQKDGNHYILNGTKNWVTNGISSDVVLVFCITEKGVGYKGISAFIVEKGTLGFSTGKKEDKLGIRGSDTCELYFENCRIPAENLLGEEGVGFKIALNTLGGGRIGIASQALGIASGAMELAVAYSKERKAFGKEIHKHQAVSFKLADMATEIEGARLLCLKAAWMKDQKKPFGKYSAMAKLFSSEVAMKTTVEAIQVHGGYGYVKEYHVERLMRDAKITQIYEGTSEVQRIVIGRAVIEE